MKKLAIYAILSTAGTWVCPAAITDSLVAYWDFEGGTANHSVATGGAPYNGALMGNAAVSGGATKVGTGSLFLDGAGDYLDVTSVVDPNQPWSVSAWYQADLAPSTTRFMVFETSGSFPISFGLREAATATNTNHQAFADIVPGTDYQGDFQIADAATAGAWHHVLLTFTPATAEADGAIQVYIDGTLRNTGVVAIGNTLGTANGFHIGTYRNANDRWFDGSIDEVAMWSRTLTPADAAEVYLRGSQGDSLTAVKFVVSLSPEPTGSGTVTGSGLYNSGATVNVTATPNPGYVFSGWTEGFAGRPATFTYTADADVTSAATFGEDTADDDGDGLTNYEEIVVYQTLPNNPDTDGDELPDGAELQIGTSPVSSDAALVSFVRQNLSTGQAGTIALSPLGITRDPGTGAVQLSLSLSGSATRTNLLPIDLSLPSVSIVPAGDGWNVTFPAPSTSVNQYILQGPRP